RRDRRPSGGALQVPRGRAQRASARRAAPAGALTANAPAAVPRPGALASGTCHERTLAVLCRRNAQVEHNSARDRTMVAAQSTIDVYARLGHVLPDVEIAALEPIIEEITRLKRERNAVLLAHNYMTPDIFHGVADLKGDSLALARMATETDADVIVMAGGHFMAETAKILNPETTVLIPDVAAGCSLAESVTAEDVRMLREQYPGVPVVTYVNTSAEVKAECDICCTSSNAVEVVNSLGTDRVIFLPDQYLGRWVASQTNVDVILWRGSCEVHERFTGEELRAYRKAHEGIKIIAHPECP